MARSAVKNWFWGYHRAWRVVILNCEWLLIWQAALQQGHQRSAAASADPHAEEERKSTSQEQG